jgi:gliding motility-associated-like protein
VGFASYRWSTGDTTPSIKITQAGVYILAQTSACGAVYRDTFEVFDAVHEINLGNDTLICSPILNFTLSVPASLTNILWSTGNTSNSINVTTSGTYYVTATSPCGIFSDTINIRFCLPEITSLNLASPTLCAGECISLSAEIGNYPQAWQWYLEGGIPDSYIGENPPPVCYDTAGVYNITLIASNNGGSDTAVSNITVAPVPQGRFADTAINVPYKTQLQLQACAEAQQAYWYKGDSLVCADCTAYRFEAKDWQSLYYCVAENAAGRCSDTCRYTVSVYDIPTDVRLPTAFSPNKDGVNDYFTVLTDNPNVVVQSLSVYNRWGQRVYHGSGSWDGTQQGTPVAVGVYYWQLRYTVIGSGKDFYKKGDVAVVR